jgi:hypothetical protein
VRWHRRVLGRAGLRSVALGLMVAAQGLLAQAPPAARVPLPPVAVEAARVAALDSAAGASLQVVVLTVGQGAAVWEMFGHNLLWIRDTVTGEEAAWNWGMFSFSEPGFLQRFLLGDTRYWMQGDDVAATLAYYASTGREVVAQELALTASQRAALHAFVRANASEESRYYRYDYFLDNCSTRLRDALDLVLDGAVAEALGATATSHSYRSETLRLVGRDAWLTLGIDFALGLPADRPLTAWETAFVPMRLRDALETVTVDDGSGGRRPLVVRRASVVPPTRPEAAATFPASQLPWRVLGIGAVVLALGLLLGRRQAAHGPRMTLASRTFVVGVHLLLGVISVTALAMWLFTRHSFWAWNPHLLIVTPLSLLVAVVVALAGASRAPRWVIAYHAVLVGGALAVGLGVALRSVLNDDAPGAVFSLWAHASWMLHLGAGMVLAPWPWLRAGSRA